MISREKKALTVTELTQAIKRHLKTEFTHLTVRGEVSNLRKQASGHCYFSLKDEGAQISAVLFKGSAQFVSHMPKVGDQVLIEGELNVYAPSGTYQIIVHRISDVGLGALFLKFHELKLALKKRGWFDPSHKRPLPPFPKTIGVVTSPTGAVIQDILSVLKRRFPRFHLILSPVKVQGEGAAKAIKKAIVAFNELQCADLLIIARGGGSFEDLAAFNDESVAEAIFLSKTPIISAVGHETDVTIADYVADVRAPTPSAAAELAVKELYLQIKFLNETSTKFTSFLKQSIKQSRLKLIGIQKHPLFANPLDLLTDYYQKIDGMITLWEGSMNQCLKGHHLRLAALEKQLKNLSIANRLKGLREKLIAYQKSLRRGIYFQLEQKTKQLNGKNFRLNLKDQMDKYLNDRKRALVQTVSHLKSINPKNLLKKGYSIPFAEKGASVIMSVREVKVGQQVFFHLHDGNLEVEIDRIDPLL